MNTVLVVGLASLYLWFLLAKASITEWAFNRLRDNEGWLGELVNCPFCAGFWISGLLLAVTGTYDPVTHLATAATVGVVANLAT